MGSIDFKLPVMALGGDVFYQSAPLGRPTPSFRARELV